MTGQLVCIMGPSGVGKDALIAYARARSDPTRLIFAHRYVTRPAGAGGENHVALSPAEFAAREAAGLLALAWESHGLRYAIGGELDLWLGHGFTVVANLAREAWARRGTAIPACRGCWYRRRWRSWRRGLRRAAARMRPAIAERLAHEVALPERCRDPSPRQQW